MGNDEPSDLTPATDAPAPAPPVDWWWHESTAHAPVPPSGAPAPAAPPGYELQTLLGRGGMGVVYRARDTRLNRTVALKLIARPDADELTLARFWAEAEVMAALKHPHVVQVYELGEHDRRPFIAMEYLAGGSLEKRLGHGPLAPRAAAALLARVASGVAAAHALGVVHRDLKPANILLTGGPDAGPGDGPTVSVDQAAPDPKVSDFGIAKRQSHALTQTLAVIGTPAYMAPEQTTGRAKFVGPPADVWALGVILYECLAGRRPFNSDTAVGLFTQIQSAEPPPVRARVPRLPRDLDTIVARCLAKEPENRYPTAAELADDLDRFGRGEPIAARPVGPVERAVRWVRHKPTAAAAYAASALVVLLAVVGGTVFGLWRAAERGKGEAVVAREEADRLRGEAEAAKAGETAARQAAERESRKLAVFEYGRAMQVAHEEWRGHNPWAAQRLLNGTRAEVRGWEWDYLDRLLSGTLFHFPDRHSDRVTAAAFSPDGTRIATASDDKTAKVWAAFDGPDDPCLTLAGHTAGLISVAFSPDGARVLTAARDDTARVWDAKTGKQLVTVALPRAARGLTATTFNADGTRILTATGDGTATLWEADTGTRLRDVRLGPGGFAATAHAAFGVSGTALVHAGWDGPVRAWYVASGRGLLALDAHPRGTRSATFSPDGSRLITGGDDETARVWDARSGARIAVLKGHVGPVFCTAFCPCGSRVVTGGQDRSTRVWDVTTGAELFALRGSQGVSAVAVSGDGGRLVTGTYQGAVGVWDARMPPEATAFELQTRPRPDAILKHAVLSADRTRIAAARHDGTAEVWDARTGTRLLAIRAHPGPVHAVAMTPDGSRLVTAGADRTARIWDAATGAAGPVLRGHTRPVMAVGVSPDGGRIVTGGADTTVRVWDALRGTERQVLSGHDGEVLTAAFSPDGSHVVSAGKDQTARLWALETGAQVRVFKGHTSAVNVATFTPDGTRILTGGADAVARLWDAASGAPLLTLRTSSNVESVAVNADATRIVTGSWPNSAVWDTETGAELLTLKTRRMTAKLAAFGADDTSIIAVEADGTVRLWDAAPTDLAAYPSAYRPVAWAVLKLRAGRPAEAAALVAGLARSAAEWSEDCWYDAACIQAQAGLDPAAAALAALAGGLSEARKAVYADQAMSFLRKAVAAGFSDPAHLATDSDLDPLRGRADFGQLHADLVKKYPPKDDAPGPGTDR